MVTILNHPDASIHIGEKNGKQSISVKSRDGFFVPVKEWTTAYPLDLIEHVFRVKGPAYLCDEIMRDEDPFYVEHLFRWDILSYATREDFAGRRVLDFGSGSGASSIVLARMLPESEIVGVELVAEALELARHRVRYHGLEDRVSFRQSPNPASLPSEIGDFDYIIFSAVFEHLLPDERSLILELLWSHLKPGGIIFLNQTPYRWFPVEMHTTGLPLINYLPDRLAFFCSRRFSRRVSPDASWPELLRKGIRGGTSGEIMRILNRKGGKAELLNPSRQGTNDHIDLWYRVSSTRRKSRTKKFMVRIFKVIRAVTGATMTPVLSLAIRKAD